MEPKRSGKPGRYFKVRNWLSEYGLSSETCGRECVLTTPRSASNSATGFDFMEDEQGDVAMQIDQLFLADSRNPFLSCRHIDRHSSSRVIDMFPSFARCWNSSASSLCIRLAIRSS